MVIYPDDMTAKQMRDFEVSNPQLPQTMRRNYCRTYDEFTSVLYDEIDNIVRDFESDANKMQELGEDPLNADICRNLRRLGYLATHDKNTRGHADITVEHKTFIWIGEGKIVRSVDNSYLKKGYDQIIHRYASGTTNANEAGLLIYCFAPDAKHVISNWFKHLEEIEITSTGYAGILSQCPKKPEFSFWSTNGHVSSGSKLRIKHIAFSMHWAPPKKKIA